MLSLFLSLASDWCGKSHKLEAIRASPKKRKKKQVITKITLNHAKTKNNLCSVFIVFSFIFHLRYPSMVEYPQTKINVNFVQLGRKYVSQQRHTFIRKHTHKNNIFAQLFLTRNARNLEFLQQTSRTTVLLEHWKTH